MFVETTYLSRKEAISKYDEVLNNCGMRVCQRHIQT